MPDTPVLEIEDAHKAFGGIRAIAGVSLAVAEGEIMGLIGPNGSGKSTLINLVSGVYRLDSGRICLRRRKIDGAAPHRIARLGIARTFQLLRLFRGLTVLDNVLIGAHLQGRHGYLAAVAGPLATAREERRLRQRAWEALDFVGLGGRAEAQAALLTSGEGRLLEIARALASDPEVILLDEPAAGLNRVESSALEQQMRRLQAIGKSVILVDHHMSLVMSVASRVTVLAEGKVLSHGSPPEVQADPRVVEAYLGSGNVYRRRRRAVPL